LAPVENERYWRVAFFILAELVPSLSDDFRVLMSDMAPGGISLSLSVFFLLGVYGVEIKPGVRLRMSTRIEHNLCIYTAFNAAQAAFALSELIGLWCTWHGRCSLVPLSPFAFVLIPSSWRSSIPSLSEAGVGTKHQRQNHGSSSPGRGFFGVSRFDDRRDGQDPGGSQLS
jgi:hypothetical protein